MSIIEEYKGDLLKGTAVSLLGCVIFWNLRKQKFIREWLLQKYSPETINKIAWASSIFCKGIGAGYLIKAIHDYKKLKGA